MTAVRTPSLVIAEVFGPTVQGEGPSLGRLASFIRLGGCNLRCTWCDTPYTWDADRFDLREELRRMPVDLLLDDVRGHGSTLVVITGGEPLLHQHQPGWPHLVSGLHALGVDIEIETNGTIAATPETVHRVTRLNVSPKLRHAGGATEARIRIDVLRSLATTGKAVFKFVVLDEEDLDEVATMTASAGIDRSQVWIMPEGSTALTVLQRQAVLADPVIARGFNLTTRLHTLIWPEERAR